MKLAAFCALALITVSPVTFAATPTPPTPTAPSPNAREVQVSINEAFVPAGFDTNSDVYLVASGIYQNGCYSWSRAEIKNVSDFEHEVTTFAKVNPGACPMVLVPYQKDIRLGRLAAGEHTVRFMSADSTYLEKTFTIE